MSDLTSWQEGNERYLSAALAWLRARLERQAGHGQSSLALSRPQLLPPAQSQAGNKSIWTQLIRRPTGAPAARTPSLLPPARGHDADDRVAEAAAAMLTAGTQPGHPPALTLLGQQLGLSRFDQELLLLCAAIELDTGTASLCARAQGDPNRPHPTFALALALFDEPSWDALSPERPLRYWRLIEITQPAGQPLTASPLRADERIVNYLKGLNYLDDRLSSLVTPLDFAGVAGDLPPTQQASVTSIAEYLKPDENLAAVQLLGPDAASKQMVAARAAATLGLRLYRLPAALVPAQAVELETLTRLWQRESLLLPVALYVDALGSEADAPQAGQASPVIRLLGRLRGSVVFLDTRDLSAGLAPGGLAVDAGKPTAAEQQSAWATALGEVAGEAPGRLAGQFNLGLSEIQQIARKALAEPAGGPRALPDQLWDACLAGTRPRLDMLAQRLEPKATWDHIVLPAAEGNLLRQIAAQVGQRNTVYQSWGFGDKMSRGLGISALFTGDAGTGKTMAAEVIANELRLNLYRIDLSAVVSKYIGETEKNLRRLFDAAEDGGAILFFDEADALFGKRSEVKDSHDRYANIEINYLLQRMEAYRGLAILATNMKSALDPAFMRRLRFVVGFPFPRAAERKIIWQKVFPPRVPATGLDFDRLARLNLTGGNIQSVALNAAFTAAQAGTPVTMPLLLDAARTELRKLGRVVNELEFRSHAAAGRVA
jgi:ATPase family associated with various cellular activities (AAA)/Winged helix domain, variant